MQRATRVADGRLNPNSMSGESLQAGFCWPPTSCLARTRQRWQRQDPFGRCLTAMLIMLICTHMYMLGTLDCFERWFHVPSELSLESCRGLFYEFCVEHEEVSKLFFGNVHKHETVTLNVLKQLMLGFIDVTKRQLNDFFPGGKFELRQSMIHCCKLTNV